MKWEEKNTVETRKEVAKCREELWEAQKNCDKDRREQLRNEAKQRAKAEGDIGWEQQLEGMVRVAESRSINRKLTAVTKGTRESSFNRIEVAQHEWYLSEQTNDLIQLHYEDGNFAAHPKADNGQYYAHHIQKVLPKDAEPVEVTQRREDYSIAQVTDGKPCNGGERKDTS